MWFIGVDIVSTFGGHAGMQSSQPLQCSTSIVTVPRLVIVRVVGSDSGMRAASHAGNAFAGRRSQPARSARSFVAMCCVRYDGIDCRIASTSASHVTRPVIAPNAPSITIDAAERVAELGRDARWRAMRCTVTRRA